MGQGIAMPAALAALGGSLLAWWAGGQGGTWLLPLLPHDGGAKRWRMAATGPSMVALRRVRCL
ncbi:hypothetical protein HAALTHF_32770n [Vreelandella aquamarina]|nr:hypothetical protein HAALTHF_32770n [Halomonas axialensis]